MSEIPAGAMRFNSDSQKLEYWNGSAWFQVHTQQTHSGTPRATFFGGTTPTTVNTIDYVEITTTGNAVDFGDLRETAKWCTADAASHVRGYRFGGTVDPVTDKIDTWNFATTGDATDFGTLTDSRLAHAGFSNAVRGIVGGGNPTNSATKNSSIETINLATTGESTAFGDTLNAATAGLIGTANQTRGLFAGGYTPSRSSLVEYVTIASTGTVATWGNLTEVRQEPAGACSNQVRALVGAGSTSGGATKKIDMLTVATTGTTQIFGDLSTACMSCMGATNNPTRGLFGGVGGPGANNVIEYVTIMSGGNAIDFGDLTVSRQIGSSCSNVHGGL